VLERPDATSSEWLAAHTSSSYGAISKCVGHPLIANKVLHPRGGGDDLLFGILSACLHFDKYMHLHALIVTFLLAAPMLVNGQLYAMVMDAFSGLHKLCVLSRDGLILVIKVSSKIFRVYPLPYAPCYS
jgi:hypothetical protein